MSGCASTLAPMPDRKHFILVNFEGLPITPEGKILGDREAEKKAGTETEKRTEGVAEQTADTPGTQEDNRCLEGYFEDCVERILSGIDKYMSSSTGPTPKRLVLYIHGGLVGLKDGLRRVADYLCIRDVLTGVSDSTRACAEVLEELKELEVDPKTLDQIGSSHFIFLNWDSGPFGSIWEDWCCVRGGVSNLRRGLPDMPSVVAARLGRGLFLAPASIGSQIENALEGQKFLHLREIREDRCLDERELSGGLPTLSLANITEGFLQGMQARKFLRPKDVIKDRLGYVTYWAFSVPRWLSVPFIQGFGTPAWEIMKRRTELVMAPRYELSSMRKGTARAFIEKLQDRVTKDGKWKVRGVGDGVDFALMLIGHSMGTMVANRILVEFPDLLFHRIVYLGAAASIDEVRASVLPYLRLHPSVQFWSFSLSDEDEANQIDYVDLYERGSLLVWIDNLFESVYAPGRRTFGRARNLKRFFQYPPRIQELTELRNQMFIVQFDGESFDEKTSKNPHDSLKHGLDPKQHGELDEPIFVNRILEIVNQNRCTDR